MSPRRPAGPTAGPPGIRRALYSILRFIAAHVRGFWSALAAFVTLGVIIGAASAAVFIGVAAVVAGGVTQGADEAALQWFATHRSPALDKLMLEATTLGDGVVIFMLVATTSVFLWLTQHRWSVFILVVGVIGGKVLNTVLKLGYDRARPSIVEAIDTVSSPSFPSGHAMGAMIAYGSVAYLVSRLEPTPRLRAATWVIAGSLILLIGTSRIYLGVHYPSDVLAGFLAGLAWLALVASSVTALGYFAPRRPETAAEEHDLDAPRDEPQSRRAS
jgi:membrane-associated phospholipid phosphatase